MDASPEWVEKIFRVNLISHWQLVQEFLPGMLKQQKGHIVSIASVASFVGVASMVDYSATKAGLLAFHEGNSTVASLSVSLMLTRLQVLLPSSITGMRMESAFKLPSFTRPGHEQH